MECREPLFLPKTTKNALPHASSYGRSSPAPPGSPSLRPRVESYSRYSPRYSPSPPSPIHPVSVAANTEPVPLPVPKNLVLMSLMEAAERTGAAMKSKDEDKEYESGDDDEQVMEGMDLLSSGYGTYVVRSRDGLLVYPHDADPHKLLEQLHQPFRDLEFHSQFGRSSPLEISYSVSSDDEEDEIEAARKDSDDVLCQTDKLGNIESAFRKVTPKKTEIISTPLLRLEHGQTVQVVSFIDGVAMLSRGRGYVLASSTQLVKGKSCFVLLLRPFISLVFYSLIRLFIRCLPCSYSR